MFNATTKEAAAALRMSSKTLRGLRKGGILRAGLHFRANGTGSVRPPLILNIDACAEALRLRTKRLMAN